ncbi:hypothetical protein LUZ60_013688 [Juncus effusus]|nr:hypothetical protein LUZ60_013688 [Juncus effusus]
MDANKACCIFLAFMIPVSFIVLMCVFCVHKGEKVHITDASLTRFDLETYLIPSLHYNMSIIMTIYNPNWYQTIDYNHMKVDFTYLYEKFDWVLVPDLYLHKKKTKRYNLTIGGNSTVLLGGYGVDSFKRSNETGYFDFELRFKGYKRYKVDTRHYDFLYVCPITVHIDRENNKKDKFKVVKCYSPSPPPSPSSEVAY